MAVDRRIPRLAGRHPETVQASGIILIRHYLPWISGAVLAGGAVFSYPGRDYVLIGLMLFLPLLDRDWRVPALTRSRSHLLAWAGLLICGVVLLAWRPQHMNFALATLLTAAIPEEWFFRAYFMARLGQGNGANVITSLLFSLVHGLTRGWTAAALVFLPSLFYGWLYQRTRDLPLLVLVHTLSNLIYILFLAGTYLKIIPPPLAG
jgi:membrane protease YdiL (CAAX protease family)